MPLRKLLGNALNLLSYCGVAFLFGEGFDRAFPYSGITVIHEHRWLGYWILASSIAVAARLRNARTDVRRGHTKEEVADLIERFLQNRLAYPQEWNDFVERSDPDPEVNAYRKRCDNLDPLVNCPAPVDEEAVVELRAIVDELRATKAD
jgi:hypothetical protein